MRVAIVHDWLVVDGGAEKVLSALLDIYPDAEIYSIVDFLSQTKRQKVLKGKFAKTSFIQKLPFAKKYFRYYLALMPKAVESFDLSEYDLVLSSSWAFAKGAKTLPKTLHICYCHTPIRYAWDLEDEYTKNLSFLKKIIVKATLKYIRKWDLATSNRPNFYIANSNFVKDRIKKHYNINSVVIYPPVDTDKFRLNLTKDNFYLCVSRMVGYKKIKLIVEAFNQTDKNLVLIGDGEELDEIRKIAGENVQILGYQPDLVVIEYMQKAKAFVYAAIEDFGIVVVEAQACGMPVIALNKGGTKESVIDGKTGILFENQDIASLLSAIEKMQKEYYNFKYENILENAKKYSRQRFYDEIINFIKKGDD